MFRILLIGLAVLLVAALVLKFFPIMIAAAIIFFLVWYYLTRREPIKKGEGKTRSMVIRKTGESQETLTPEISIIYVLYNSGYEYSSETSDYYEGFKQHTSFHHIEFDYDNRIKYHPAEQSIKKGSCKRTEKDLLDDLGRTGMIRVEAASMNLYDQNDETKAMFSYKYGHLYACRLALSSTNRQQVTRFERYFVKGLYLDFRASYNTRIYDYSEYGKTNVIEIPWEEMQDSFLWADTVVQVQNFEKRNNIIGFELASHDAAEMFAVLKVLYEKGVHCTWNESATMSIDAVDLDEIRSLCYYEDENDPPGVRKLKEEYRDFIFSNKDKIKEGDVTVDVDRGVFIITTLPREEIEKQKEEAIKKAEAIVSFN